MRRLPALTRFVALVVTALALAHGARAEDDATLDDTTLGDATRDAASSLDDQVMPVDEPAGDDAMPADAAGGEAFLEEPRGPGAAGLDDENFAPFASADMPPLELDPTFAQVRVVHVGGQGTRVSIADDLVAVYFAGRLQTRFVAEVPGDKLVPSRLEQPTRIEITRARLYGGLSILDERLRFDLRLDPALGIPSVLDASVEVTAIRPWLSVVVGQNRTYFSRQFSTRAGQMQFGDRPITTAAFDPGRDLGVLVQSGTQRTPVLVTAGVFQGHGMVADGLLERGRTALIGERPIGLDDVPDARAVAGRPLFVARLMGGYGRANPYVENDLEGGPLRLSFGAGVLARADVDDIAFDETAVTLDAMLKVRGASVSGAIFSSARRDDGPLAVAPSRSGFHVQGGYAWRGLVEPVARYAVVTEGLDGALMQEALMGVNAFALGGHLRWQTDLGVVHDAPSLRVDMRDVSMRFRTQLDVSF